MSPRSESSSGSKLGALLQSEFVRRYRILVALLVLGAIATYVWIGCCRQDFRTIVADRLQVPRDSLYVNLPPLGPRDPATVILLKAGGNLFFHADPPPIWRKTPALDSVSIGDTQDLDAMTRGGADVLRLALKKREVADVMLEINDYRPVTAPIPELSALLQPRELFDRLSGAEEPVVVVRAFEGLVTLRMRRKSSTSLETWTSAGNEVEKAASDPASEAGVTWEGNRGSEGSLVVKSKTPIVFAFEVLPLETVLKFRQGDRPALGSAHPFEGGTGKAVDALLRVGPATVPSLALAMREIDEEGAQRVIKALSDEDPARRTSAALLAAHLPAPRGVHPAPEDALRDGSPRERAWAVANAMKDGVGGLHLLVSASTDSDPGIRFFATHAVGNLGAAGSSAVPALERAVADQDSVVHFEALHSLQLVAPARFPKGAFEEGLKSPDLNVRRAAAHYVGKERLIELKSGPDPLLRSGATEAIDRGWVVPRTPNR